MLPDCLVDHFYAQSHVRDGERIIRDPYNLTHDFGVFVSHMRLPDDAKVEELATVASQRDYWRAYAVPYVKGSVFTEQDRDEFVRRADQGLADGLFEGAAPRRMRTFDRADRASFRPFKT